MNKFNVDATNCDREPIRSPGMIQSHGFMIGIDQQMLVQFFSENIKKFLPSTPDSLLGESISVLDGLLSQQLHHPVLEQLIAIGKTNGFEQINPISIEINGKPFYLMISPSTMYYLLEFEPAQTDLDVDLNKIIGRSIAEMLGDKNLNNLLNNAVAQIKKITSFDRVMIYRFAADHHGEVVAEARNEGFSSWLGLHYPASDIPEQARELYKINLTRLITDVHAEPARLVTAVEDKAFQLDLSHAQLRAVSPIHIEYLKNMKVATSFSISLIYHGQLWGLIACHHYSPRFIDYKSRESSKLISQILSSALEFRQDEENEQKLQLFRNNVDALSRQLMMPGSNIIEALTAHKVNLLEVTDCNGAVLLYENNIKTLGITPSIPEITELVSWIKDTVHDRFYHTTHLKNVFPKAESYQKIASGLLVCVLSKELNEYLLWFKPEYVQTINWAGKQEKEQTIDGTGLVHLSPRKSFEIWSETVIGKSKSWNREEIKAVKRLKEEIVYTINLKANQIRQLNEKLQKAYQELDTFSYTISHDLKTPLSTIKGFSQILKREKSLTPHASNVVDRILASTDKMNYMIKEVLEYSRINQGELSKVDIQVKTLVEDLIRDLRIAYQTDNLEVIIGNMPMIKGDPLMISQVFSNLLSNAIKYSSKNEHPCIRIEGNLQGSEVVYRINDNGIGIHAQELSKVFDLFKRMENVQNIEGTGIGLAIVKRIIEKHNGHIWVESTLGEGSTFFISFTD
ncbi:light-regulated signal transduction histidine kinase (bacteriophytochrome) [Pedobacter sp. CAN_A7]|uniref:ATP-binding protein n=1 Tax=Pedobacter sp. CAN_A7 TaxID=2787722 RepID=UPI0018C94DA0